jgi:GTPase SAR1 family protein
VGLDNSGKTTILTCVSREVRKALNESSEPNYYTNVTIGLELVQFKMFGRKWKIWDMSGHGKYRPYWDVVYGQVQVSIVENGGQHILCSDVFCFRRIMWNLQGIIYVVDALDVDRVANVRDEFAQMLNHAAVKNRNIPILVFLNKMDIGDSDALTQDNVEKILVLYMLKVCLSILSQESYESDAFFCNRGSMMCKCSVVVVLAGAESMRDLNGLLNESKNEIE